MYKNIKGVKDILCDEYNFRENIIDNIIKYIKQYGYKPVILPILEDKCLFLSDDLNKELYYVINKHEKSDNIVLRPEGTASIIRMIMNHNIQEQKFLYYGPMFRHDRPQKCRLREFYQLGIEYIGSNSILSDLEMIKIASDILENVTLHINTIGEINEREEYIKILREYFNDRKHELQCENNINRIDTNTLRILDSKYDRNIIDEAPHIIDSLSNKSRDRFYSLLQILDQMNISYIHDHSLVRGLDYYCHSVFEFKSTKLDISQNTILAGGRYNNMLNSKLYGIGWALGVERLLENIDKVVNQNDIHAISIESIQLFNLFSLLKEKYNIISMYNGMNKDIKKANKLNVKCFLFQDNQNENNIIIKDLHKSIQYDPVNINQVSEFIEKII